MFRACPSRRRNDATISTDGLTTIRSGPSNICSDWKLSCRPFGNDFRDAPSWLVSPRKRLQTGPPNIWIDSLSPERSTLGCQKADPSDAARRPATPTLAACGRVARRPTFPTLPEGRPLRRNPSTPSDAARRPTSPTLPEGRPLRRFPGTWAPSFLRFSGVVFSFRFRFLFFAYL